jgi:hypothetical protein
VVWPSLQLHFQQQATVVQFKTLDPPPSIRVGQPRKWPP